MKYSLIIFIVIFSYNFLFSYDNNIETRLEAIENKIDNLEKKINQRTIDNNGEIARQKFPPSLTGKEIIIKSNILKTKIISRKKIIGNKKSGVLLEILILNPSKYDIKTFIGDLYFYKDNKKSFYTYKIYENQIIKAKNKIIYPIMIYNDLTETFFYFIKYKKINVILLNQKLIIDSKIQK